MENKDTRLIETDLLEILMQAMGKAAGEFRKGIITLKELKRRNTFDTKAMRLVQKELKLSEDGLFKEAKEAHRQLEDLIKKEGLL